MRLFIFMLAIFFLAACGGGDTSSGGGNNPPANQINYRTLNLTTGAITESTTMPSAADPAFYATNMVFRRVPAGTGITGTSASSLGVQMDEPSPSVITMSEYWIAVVELTQGQWLTLTNDPINVPWKKINPASVVGMTQTDNKRPVFGVTREELQTVLSTWNAQFTTADVRIPTQNEWEYACRAGTTTAFAWGDSIDPAVAGLYAACFDSYFGPSGANQVGGSRLSNAWGIWDMHGNVREWAGEGSTFVLRGGGWSDNILQARSANKFTSIDTYRHALSGARLVLVTP
jgi:formylglycine-generating enzyme required for sulfatase activity